MWKMKLVTAALLAIPFAFGPAHSAPAAPPAGQANISGAQASPLILVGNRAVRGGGGGGPRVGMRSAPMRVYSGGGGRRFAAPGIRARNFPAPYGTANAWRGPVRSHGNVAIYRPRNHHHFRGPFIVGLPYYAYAPGYSYSYADAYDYDYDYDYADVGDDGGMAQCRARYRSFDPESGTFLGNDGERHMCPYLGSG